MFFNITPNTDIKKGNVPPDNTAHTNDINNNFLCCAGKHLNGKKKMIFSHSLFF